MNLKTNPMKHFVITIATVLFTSIASSQDKNIETESVTIDNFISFIVNKIGPVSEEAEQSSVHMTFLLQTSVAGLSTEDKVILKQAFKLISDRLGENDHISIITYSGFNGMALGRTSPKELKSITYVLEHLKSSVKEFQDNGIEYAYQYAEENYIETATNTIVMVRNPNAGKIKEIPVAGVQKKSNMALITAIALLPEIISVIKD